MKWRMLLAFLLAVSLCRAEEKSAKTVTREKNKAVAEQEYRDRVAKEKNNPDLLVLPGLVADRKSRQVRFLAEATGVKAVDIVEFFLIGENSGHDYEAIAVSLAKPGDVHRALEFVGMKPGRPVVFSKLQLWPKGERVTATIAPRGATNSPVRLEQTVLDRRSGKALAAGGFVFTGSVMADSTEKPGTQVYAADAFEPGSIAANYNEAQSVLDVPRQAPQKQVYESMFANPDHLFQAGQLLEVTMEPEYKDGRTRVLDLTLHITTPEGKSGAAANGLSFRLDDAAGKPVYAGAEMKELMRILSEFAASGRDPFVALRLGDSVSVSALRDLCRILDSINTENGIRIEPPGGNQLFYKAFIPNEVWRDRAGRMAQPWELRLELKDGKPAGVLTQVKEVWKDEQARPDLKPENVPVPTPADLQKALTERGPGLNVILVFAPPALTHGQLMEFVGPVLKTHPVIHVFVDVPVPTP